MFTLIFKISFFCKQTFYVSVISTLQVVVSDVDTHSILMIFFGVKTKRTDITKSLKVDGVTTFGVGDNGRCHLVWTNESWFEILA